TQSISQGTGQSCSQLLDTFKQLLFRPNDDLRGRTWCRGAEIRDEIRDRKIDLVTHCRDHRLLRADDCPSHPLLVEWPKIFHRTPATGDDNHIHVRTAIEKIDAIHNLQRSAISLNFSGEDQYVHGVMTTFKYGKKIP